MNTTTRRVRRFAASVTFAAVAGGLALPMLASPAGAIQDTTTSRLQGDDRYGTAAAAATDTFPDGAASVVLATGEAFADALAANGLAGALDAPILLTTTDALPAVTESALTTLAPTTVYVMGGTAAVSQAVEDELADYEVIRVEGQDRFETAAAAGAAIADTDDGVPATTDDGLGSTSDGLTAVLANGFDFPDAVSGGPIAFAGRLPVLLTNTTDTPEATTTALEALGIEHVLLIGGTAVISDAVKTELESAGYTTERLAGTDRWRTNVAVNDYAAEEFGFGGATVYLATGRQFPDSLAGGPVAGTNTAPLVLTEPTSLPAPTRDYLVANANAIDDIVALGGTAAVTDATLTAAADAAQLSTNDVIAVAPAETEVRQMSSSPLSSDGARTYTVSGLEAGTEYVIALLDAETVEVGDPDRFSSYSLSDEASTSIESVNGSQVGAAGGVETVQETAEAQADGTITFVVDATAFDEIIPVVYEDLDGNGELAISQGRSDEPYGLGGKTTWVPQEAASNTAGAMYEDLAVTVARPDDGFFIASVPVQPTGTASRTFFFDDLDRFRLLGVATTPSVFESRLSVGDLVDAEYQQDLQSRFDLVVDDGPEIVGLAEGTTVATNAGLEELNGGDVWLLHFSDDVTVSSSASIVVRGPDSTGRFSSLTLTNGTDTSTWTVNGDTITITVGRGADVTEMFYGETTTVVDLSGVARAADAVAVTEADLTDTVLEDDGPELMPGTSTCDAGDNSCTIEFNEPVNTQDASNPMRYTFQRPGGGGPTLLTASVAGDGRTVTLGFGGALAAGDQIRPVGSSSAVRDAGGDPSDQEFVVFVS